MKKILESLNIHKKPSGVNPNGGQVLTEREAQELVDIFNEEYPKTYKEIGRAIDEGLAFVDKKNGYLRDFINTPPTAGSVRSGKQVFISPENHERISRIVTIIGGKETNISTYINTVLDAHFNKYGDVIRDIYKEKYSKLF